MDAWRCLYALILVVLLVIFGIVGLLREDRRAHQVERLERYEAVVQRRPAAPTLADVARKHGLANGEAIARALPGLSPADLDAAITRLEARGLKAPDIEAAITRRPSGSP